MSYNLEERKERAKCLNLVMCDCGYCNKQEYVNKYGSCLCCGKIFDKHTHFIYNMKKKMAKNKNKIRYLIYTEISI